MSGRPKEEEAHVARRDSATAKKLGSVPRSWSAGVARLASAGPAGHCPRPEVVQRLSARIPTQGAVVGLQLVNFEPTPDLPRLLRLVIHGGSVNRVNRRPWPRSTALVWTVTGWSRHSVSL